MPLLGLSVPEFKSCKPQSARPDPYQTEMGDPGVELEAQAAAGASDKQGFLCGSRQDHAHRIAQRQHTEFSSKRPCAQSKLSNDDAGIFPFVEAHPFI